MKWYKLLTTVTTVIFAITAIVLCLSIYFGYSGTGDIYTAEIIGGKLAILAWPALLWVVSIVIACIAEKKDKNRKREPLAGVKMKEYPAASKAVLAARIAVGIIAVGMIAFGIANGGMRDVLVKAINICSECIGLG